MTSPLYAIELLRLRFAYGRGPEVLDIPEFTIYPGSRVFLHGPSGSGKTTLLGIIAGVLVPTAADRWRLLQRDLTAMSQGERDELRGIHVGYLFQLFNLLPWLSVLDNVMLPVLLHPERRSRLGAEEPRDAARALIERLDLAAFVDTPVTDLSVGQQQRVAAARALIGRPELVIADEPTSSLDAGRRSRFLDLLFAECEAAGSTLLFVSHDLSLGDRFQVRHSLPDLNRAAAR